MEGEWRQVTLGELVKSGGGLVQTGPFGSQLHAADYVESGLPCIMPVNIGPRRVELDGIARITEEDAARLSKHLVQDGDIVCSRRGDVTRKALVGVNEERMICGTGCLLVRSGTEVNAEFLNYHLSAPRSREWIVRHAIGATMPNLNTSILSAIPLQIPSRDIQNAIVEILRSLDDKIELNRQTNETLEAMAQALFKSWFVDFDPVIDKALAAGNDIPESFKARAAARQALGDARKPLPEEIRREFPDGFEFRDEMGWVPVGWKKSSVGQLFDFIMGQSPPGSTYNTESVGMPFFQGKTGFQFRCPKNRVYCTDPRRIANPGDTLVSVRAPVGSVNIALEECCLGRGVASIRHSSNVTSFTYYSMKKLGETFKKFDGEGTVFGSINKNDFAKLKILDFPIGTVRNFENVAKRWDERIRVGTESNIALSRMRDTLLPKLLSGQLAIPDAEKLIATAT